MQNADTKLESAIALDSAYVVPTFSRYGVEFVKGDFKITRAKVTVTADDKEKGYGDDDPELTASVSGLKRGDAQSVIAYTISREGGEDTGHYEITPAGNRVQGNYDVEFVKGDLEIKKGTGNEVTPEPGDGDESMSADGKSITVKYDGKEHTVKASADKPDSKIEFSTDGGETWSEDAPVRTDAGTTQFMVRATNKNYEDVERGPFELTVTKRELIIVSASATKVYDGQELTDATYTVEGDGFADGEEALVEVTGSRTNVGSSPNEFTVEVMDKGDITLLAADDGDGDTAGDGAGDAADDTKMIDLNNYDVKKREGTLTVTKAKLTITTPDATKNYDGKPLTSDGSIEGLVNGETVTFKTTGSQTRVGSSTNTYSLTWDGTAQEGNYEIVEKLGTLKVAQAPKDPNDDPGNGGNNGNGGKDNNGSGDSSGTKGQTPASAAQTGDQMDLMPFVMLMFAAMAVMLFILLFTRRRREDEQDGR